MSTMTTPTTTTNRKFGRVRPVAHGPGLKLSRYISLSRLPTPPATIDYSKPATTALSMVYLNDQLGSCVPAGIAHDIGIFTANADGTPATFTDEQIETIYSDISGYVPGDPSTDRGCDEVAAVNLWRQRGFFGHQIAGWIEVDATNQDHVRAAEFVLENLFFGIELPDPWVEVQDSGFVWDDGTPNPQNGHCVVACGYDAAGIQVDTWGLIGTLTWGALQRDVIAASGGQLLTVLTTEAISRASAKTPSGFDWEQLVDDFNALGGGLDKSTVLASTSTSNVSEFPMLSPDEVTALRKRLGMDTNTMTQHQLADERAREYTSEYHAARIAILRQISKRADVSSLADIGAVIDSFVDRH